MSQTFFTQANKPAIEPIFSSEITFDKFNCHCIQIKMNGYTDLNTITDPTDFKSTTVPKLFELDSLVRCHICKEFLSSPMLTSCGHTFCSGCVRKYVLHTPKCPICSKELRESNLSRNVVLEQLVISYKALRGDLIQKLRIPKEPEETKQVKSKTNEFQHSTESTPSTTANPTPEVIDLDDDETDENVTLDDELQILEETKKKRRQPMNIDAMFKKQKTTIQKRPTTESGTCPICSKVLPMEILQGSHIDECLSHPQPQSQSLTNTVSASSGNRYSSTINKDLPYFQPKESTNTYQKLTKLDYASLSITQLKSKLSKLELPTAGTRHEMETRYNEYLILWNANCDSVQPKNPKLLRSQLAKWESAIKVKPEGNDKLAKEDWKVLIDQARSTLKNKHLEKDTDND